MTSELRKGIISHPDGLYLRERDRSGQVYRLDKGQVTVLRRQVEEAGGLSAVIKNYDPSVHSFDSGVYVSFVPSGRPDNNGTPYATDIRLSK